MDRITIDHDSPEPPFEQLRSQVAALVASGDLAPGTRLGTVRRTAADLGLAVNTVARAYRELEADGVVVTKGRHGTFVRSETIDGTTDAATDGTTDAATLARRAAADFVRTARRSGLARQEALRLVQESWDHR